MNHKIAKAFQKYQYLSIDQLVSLLKHYPLEIKRIREASYAQVMKGGLSFKGSNRRFGIETISMYLCNGEKF